MDPEKREGGGPRTTRKVREEESWGQEWEPEAPSPQSSFSAHSPPWETSSPPRQPGKANENPSVTDMLLLLPPTPSESATAVPASHAHPEPALHLSPEVCFPARPPTPLAGSPIPAQRGL